VRQLVELHGGTIRAQSAGKGHGATFTVDLPVLAVRLPQAGPAIDALREAVKSRGLEGVRVLVVDDQADARELVALVLAEYGFDAYVTKPLDPADLVGLLRRPRRRAP